MLKTFALIVSLIVSYPAFAERTLPNTALRGELTSTQYPFVTIGGKRYQLAPGAKVYDKENRIIMPTLYPARAPVAYQVDFNGDISKIWLLTVQEQRKFKKK